jgi:peroxiredoxin Q/BCP
MSSAILSAILGASSALHVGDVAPDFTLPDSDGGQMTLSRLLEQGPVVLFFFPKAFTPGCSRQAANFRDHLAEIEKKGAHVLAISADDAPTLKRFKEERKAPYTFLSDPEKKVIKLYSGTMPVVGLANRANYVIDRDRKVLSLVEGSDAIDPTASIGACPGHG